MAFGVHNSNFTKGPLLIFKPTTRDKDKKEVEPHFAVVKRENGVTEELPNSTFLSGDLVSLKIKEESFKDNKYKKVNVIFRDGEESYLLDLRFNNNTRSFFNALLNVQETKGLEVQFKRNKRTGFANFVILSGGEMVKWKYPLDEVPKPEEIKKKDGTLVSRDYTEVDAFFESKLLEKFGAGQSGEKEVDESSTDPDVGEEDEDDSSIPF